MFHFTDHVKDRMREREISEKEVQDCLENYQVSYPNDDDDDDDDDIMNYVYTYPDGRRIRVVVNEKRPDHKIVISVM